MTRLTIESIGQLAGVSRSTVSRVINNQPDVAADVRKRVLDIIEATGYAPHSAARSLAGRRSRILGIAIPETTEIVFADPFFSHVISGASRVCNLHEYTLSLFLFHDAKDETKLLDRVIRSSVVDGLIVTATYLDDPLIGRLLDREIPFVLIGEHGNPDVSFVDSDSEGGAAAAVTHLLELGRTRIATVSGPMRNAAARRRQQGYERALGTAGLPVRRELIAEGDYSQATARTLTDRLLEARPDALFVASDTMAIGAMQAIRAAGLRIPGDVAVVGFDDLPAAAHADPPLTTVRYSVPALGGLAVQMLLDLLDAGAEAAPRRITLPAELVVRASTVSDAPPAGGGDALTD